MIRHTHILFTLLLFGVTHFNTSAQNEEYIGVGNQNRIIERSAKLEELPQSHDTSIYIPPINYYVNAKQHSIQFEPEPINPARLKVAEPVEKLYAGYIKGGVGNYTMPFLDVNYNSTRSKKNAWGIHGKHHSALSPIKDVGNSRFSDNEIDGFYKHFLRKHVIQTNPYYTRNVINYYGFDANDSTIPQSYRENKDDIRQGYHHAGLKTILSSNHKSVSKINHTVGLDYYFLRNFDLLNENNVVAYTSLSKYLDGEEIEARLDFSVDYNALKQSTLMPIDTIGVVVQDPNTPTVHTGIVRFVPHVITSKNNYFLKGGFGANIDMTATNNFYFFPEVEVSYNLFNDVFIPYAGATGGVIRNSFNHLRKTNPFILSNSEVKNTVERINLFGGIRGGISSKWTFNTTVRFQRLKDYALFFNDTIYAYENAFGILYDDISKTTFSGQLAYQNGEKLKISAKGEYFINKSDNQEFAWLQPDFKFSLNGIYDLADKIIIRADVFVVGNRKAFSLLPQDNSNANDAHQYVLDLKPYVDANLGIEYRYNKRLSAFINFNNLAAQKYQQWTNFPIQRFNVLGGLTFAF